MVSYPATDLGFRRTASAAPPPAPSRGTGTSSHYFSCSLRNVRVGNKHRLVEQQKMLLGEGVGISKCILTPHPFYIHDDVHYMWVI